MYVSRCDGDGPLTEALRVVALAVLVGCVATIAGWGPKGEGDASPAGSVDGGGLPAEGARQLDVGVRSD